jgi:hypothetical protein
MMFGKMSEVKIKIDFTQWFGFGPDMSINVLGYLDDPCDLLRVSFVSRSWNQFGKPFDLIRLYIFPCKFGFTRASFFQGWYKMS